MLADTDAGNVVTAAQSGARWGYRLLPLVLLLIPMLYMVQELTVRLGLYTGRGHGELIRARFGLGWALLSTLGLAGAVIGSLITEFTGVAGVGELFGLSRAFTLPLAAATLLIIVASGSYKRVERAALIIGLFELAFFVVAWAAHPGLKALARDAIDLPIRNRDFLFMVAAIIGATFNPWMIFYQQSATVDKKLRPGDLVHARWDTGDRRGSDPVPDRGGAGRRRGGVRQRRRVLEPLDGGRNQRRAHTGAGRRGGADRVQRRRARSVAGRGDRLLSGAGLGRRRGRGLPAFAGIPAVRRRLVLTASTRPAS